MPPRYARTPHPTARALANLTTRADHRPNPRKHIHLPAFARATRAARARPARVPVPPEVGLGGEDPADPADDAGAHAERRARRARATGAHARAVGGGRATRGEEDGGRGGV